MLSPQFVAALYGLIRFPPWTLGGYEHDDINWHFHIVFSKEESSVQHRKVKVDLTFATTTTICAVSLVSANFTIKTLNGTSSSCRFSTYRYRDPCSASLNEDDLHTTKLIGDKNRRVSFETGDSPTIPINTILSLCTFKHSWRSSIRVNYKFYYFDYCYW